MTSPLDLCDMCATIFKQFDIHKHYKHHASNDALEAAAQKGCYICCPLQEKVTALCLKIQPPDSLEPADTRGLFYAIQNRGGSEYELDFFEYRHSTGPQIKVLTLTVHPPHGM